MTNLERAAKKYREAKARYEEAEAKRKAAKEALCGTEKEVEEARQACEQAWRELDAEASK